MAIAVHALKWGGVLIQERQLGPCMIDSAPLALHGTHFVTFSSGSNRPLWDCDCDGCHKHDKIANATFYRDDTGCRQACQDDPSCKTSLYATPGLFPIDFSAKCSALAWQRYRESYPDGTPAHHCYLYYRGQHSMTQRCAPHPFTCWAKTPEWGFE